jgi:hypothetical protein
VALFVHGAEAHSLISTEQSSPVQPVAQWHVEIFSIQTPCVEHLFRQLDELTRDELTRIGHVLLTAMRELFPLVMVLNILPRANVRLRVECFMSTLTITTVDR